MTPEAFRRYAIAKSARQAAERSAIRPGSGAVHLSLFDPYHIDPERDAAFVSAVNRQGGLPHAVAVPGGSMWLDEFGHVWRHTSHLVRPRQPVSA